MNPFNTILQQFQYYDKYSRYRYDLGRREHWPETVKRTIDYLQESVEVRGARLPDYVWRRLEKAIHDLEVMPSMRNLAMAGAAARRSNIVSYNCAYAPIVDLYSFYEAVIILMSGSGLGYSVERQYINQLPAVQPQKNLPTESYRIPDTTEGWADSIMMQLALLINGRKVEFDYRNIRPAGTPLKGKGGRASGPAHLELAHTRIQEIVLSRQGERLRPLDVHDIMCHIAEAIVSGGVRRSAMIALFDFDDQEMRTCKSGANIVGNEQRWYANNSAVWTGMLSSEEVTDFMNDMFDSGRGEPGIFNRLAASITRPKRRVDAEWGTNPCGEIFLRPYQFCNLTSVVTRPDDTEEDLLQKVELATILGTIQSMSDHFPGLRPEWKKNAEEERLLGVDLNGVMDNELARRPDVLARLKAHAVLTNRLYARELGINQAAAVTCVKPSGNSSTMLDTAPGMHARWSAYYIRRAQVQSESPLRHLLQTAGVECEPQTGSTASNAKTWVLSFPTKSPDSAITREDVTALSQCELWLKLKTHYTEHNPSVTITYLPEDRESLTEWVFQHQDRIGGMAFLPHFDAAYEQMPYEAIDAETYHALAAELPQVNWHQITLWENGSDKTNVGSVYACDSEKCELVYA